MPRLGFRGSVNSKPCSLVEGTCGVGGRTPEAGKGEVGRGRPGLEVSSLADPAPGRSSTSLIQRCPCPPANCVASALTPRQGLEFCGHSLSPSGLLPSLPARVSGLISALEGRQFLNPGNTSSKQSVSGAVSSEALQEDGSQGPLRGQDRVCQDQKDIGILSFSEA